MRIPTFQAVLLVSAVVLTPQSLAVDLLKEGQDLLEEFTPTASGTDLSVGEIGRGLKQALKVGTGNVVGQLGATDGFNGDPAIHIPLPDSLDTVRNALDTVGMSGMLDDLETKLNRAAEKATPKAKRLFWDAISDMTLDDVKGIYDGPDDAATRYFQEKMSAPLAQEMSPIVDRSLSSVGAIKSYNDVMGEYESLPFVPDATANLTDYVVERGMDGIFHYLAQEEAAIRSDPVKRTTALLQKVFGAK